MATSNQTPARTVFSFKAPGAQSVQLAGDFTGWDQAPLSLKRAKNGLWKTTVVLPPGNYQYRFLVDGQWRDDPSCDTRVPNPFGAENCLRQLS